MSEHMDREAQHLRELKQLSGDELVGLMAISDLNGQSARDAFKDAQAADSDAHRERQFQAAALKGRRAVVQGKVKESWEDRDPWGYPETRSRYYTLKETEIVIKSAYVHSDNGDYAGDIPADVGATYLNFDIPNPDPEDADEFPTISVTGDVGSDPESDLVLIVLGEVAEKIQSDAA